jgi:hypothetical protein
METMMQVAPENAHRDDEHFAVSVASRVNSVRVELG